MKPDLIRNVQERKVIGHASELDCGRFALRSWIGICAFGWMTGLTPVFAGNAPPVPTAGGAAIESQKTQQDVEKLFRPEATGPSLEGPPRPQQDVGKKGGVTFPLKRVDFDASRFVSQAELQAIAAPYVGRKVDISDLQTIVKKVNDVFAARNLITAIAYLPPQDLGQGVLHVAIVEGKLGEMAVKGNRILSDGWIRSAVDVAPGAVVDVPAIERDVARFNVSSNAQIRAALKPGVDFGLTDITLSVLEPPTDSVQAFFDNQGSKATGIWEGGLNYQRYNILGIDDKLFFNVLGSEGNHNFNLAYNLPFNRWGGRLGVSAGYGQIQVVGGDYKFLNITGTSENEAFNISQPLYVDPSWALLLNGSVGRSVSKSEQSGISIAQNETIKETAGLTASYAGAVLAFSVSPSISTNQAFLHIGGSRYQFTSANLSAAGTVQMPLGFVGKVNGSAQWANRTQLTGDQQFQIGGPLSVRGYDTGSASGYAGYSLSVELHHTVAPQLQGLDAFVFYDRGSVYNPFPKAIAMESVGAGLSWTASKNLVADLSFGVPIARAVDGQPRYAVYLRLATSWP
ncbi:hemolysin activation/secretion protein [Rhizobium aquaticum]|uniref:Hemolysin activation/secretion protein n=1 Tax=Rhizobium aquaticum TaxID=1549636 RepID=A0ABV2J632_9HYPH